MNERERLDAICKLACLDCAEEGDALAQRPQQVTFPIDKWVTVHVGPDGVRTAYIEKEDDEAVRLLREAQQALTDSTHPNADKISGLNCPFCKLLVRIDAYLAKSTSGSKQAG